MPLRIGTPELIIILVIILLLFGVGRISKIAGELGSGVKAFRTGLQSDKNKTEDDDKKDSDTPEPDKS